jgi:hypothetical protein
MNNAGGYRDAGTVSGKAYKLDATKVLRWGTSKYEPHQGAKEIARRARRMKGVPTLYATSGNVRSRVREA